MNRLSVQLTESAAWNNPEPVQNIYTGHKPGQNSKKKIYKLIYPIHSSSSKSRTPS